MIQGKNVSFRALEESDLETLRNWRNKKHVRKTTREYRLLNMINQKKCLNLYIKILHKTLSLV